jgi:hypothetical protein
MSLFTRLAATALVALCLTPACGGPGNTVSTPALAAQNPPPKVEEYVPISQLPPEDQLPAAPLLISAYAFVLMVFFLYVVSLARRLTNVQRDVDRLEASLKQTGKP